MASEVIPEEDFEGDFYHFSEGILPPMQVTEADKAMARRWYGFEFLKQSKEEIGIHAWRISRERQLIAALTEVAEAKAQVVRMSEALKSCTIALSAELECCLSSYCIQNEDDDFDEATMNDEERAHVESQRATIAQARAALALAEKGKP